jgi:cation transport regulator ChaB
MPPPNNPRQTGQDVTGEIFSALDPITVTNEILNRGLLAEREYVDAQLDVIRERLRGIDMATRLLNETVNRVPTDVQKEVAHLRELIEKHLGSIALQFKERDSRSERESRDNKVAVDAAFAAQKEAAAEQNKSNTLAISKSEAQTTESINKLAELFKTTTGALSDKLEDLKSRVNGVESFRRGAVEHRTTGQAATSNVTTILGAVFALILIIFTFLNYQTNRARTPTVVTPPPTVTVTTPSNP